MDEGGSSGVRTRSAIDALSPAALAALLDHSPDCVLLIAPDGSLLYANGRALRMLEVDRFDQVAGRKWMSLLPPAAVQNILDTWRIAGTEGASRFRTFYATVTGLPRWYDVTVTPVTDSTGEPGGWLSVSRDVTENQAARQALEINSAEIKHRLKNTYTMIASLLNAFARGNADHEAFARAMTERLAALSTAQALFLSNEAHCEIARLIPALVAPFDTSGCPVVVDEQCAVIVDQGIADAIALVLGELSVNSAKHGALNHGGEIHVGSHAANGLLRIRWAERTGRAIRQRERDGGQGLNLMQRIVCARGGSIELEWQVDGLTVTMIFPHEGA